MACSVAPALPHEMFHRVGAAPHQMMSKARHRRTGAVDFALEMSHDAADEEAEVLRPVVVPADSDESFSIPLPGEDDEAVVAKTKTKRRWGGDIKRKILASARRANVLVKKQQATPALQPDVIRTGPREVGALEAYAVRKGLLRATQVPESSLPRSSPEMTAAFLAYTIAAAAEPSSDTPIDHDLVTRWVKNKEACSRRARYLRDNCPFQREEEDLQSSEPEGSSRV